jgi:hypothetical protein
MAGFFLSGQTAYWSGEPQTGRNCHKLKVILQFISKKRSFDA